MRDEGPDPHDAASWSPIDSREWYEAREAAASLRDVLVAAGMERDFPYLRADLNAFGQGFIELGRIAPETAERVTHLLRLAMACPQDVKSVGGPPDRSSD
ncbi:MULTISPECIES: hypothetical protein [Streptomyces]|uniref:Uncharacterized protein n=2 Tax=Streptomyces TaxID=1883 RepID=A0A3R7IAB7_9ACTN|nr:MULTISPECIES: hypothetical protein [Streptomyces]KNE83495.1 hypothetical protein ADZ36_05345 [Streptomyces fradiae]OFA61981.1 hypothetical protein BEN35_00720 [Streptomyces fradiae]PQM24306.1 hypothetical protein Sfr7A_05870 [Streptomyces xinghaiensis]RKM97273.1 hypothetical protein SFRA_008555 [Streptomyces xinghaiensis]RNC75332.1 hypothetical protein DC095_006045 [Streptomyces xinghaiensis]